jgi:hypothetical protein
MLPVTINYHGCVAFLPIVLGCTKPSKILQKLNSVGDHLKKKRIGQLLTQLELAKHISVEVATVFNSENTANK